MNARRLILAALCFVLAAYCLAAAAAGSDGLSAGNPDRAKADDTADPRDQDKNDLRGDEEEVKDEPVPFGGYTGTWFRINAGQRHYLDIPMPAGQSIVALEVVGEGPLTMGVYNAAGALLGVEVYGGGDNGGIACGQIIILKMDQTCRFEISNQSFQNNGYQLHILAN